MCKALTTQYNGPAATRRADCNRDGPPRMASWPEMGLVLHEASRRQIRTMWQLPDVANCLIGMASRAKRFLISTSFR